jgi:DNA repair photolyase
MAKMTRTTDTNLELFPILPSSPGGDVAPLAGIARLAAASAPAATGHGLEVRSLGVRSILNRSVSRRGLSFTWSINPYRGCEFACRYCYARYTHEFMELAPEEFERRIFIKENAAWLLEQELRQVRSGEEIALGTATDPYQPVERHAKVTQSLLEVLARQRGLRIGLVTKSTLIERDIPLLERIAENNTLVLHLTITTPNAALARLLEPRAPRPDLRLRTVARLRQAGLTTGILCSPLLPGITDTRKALDGMAKRAKDAGVSFFSAQPLFLKPCSKEIYLGFIRAHFPSLEPMYRKRFDSEAFVSRAYGKRIEELVKTVCTKYGLGRRRDALLTMQAGGASGESLDLPGTSSFIDFDRKPSASRSDRKYFAGAAIEDHPEQPKRVGPFPSRQNDHRADHMLYATLPGARG